MSIFKKIFSGVKKQILNEKLHNDSFWVKIQRFFIGKTEVDAEVLDQLEEFLISYDVGVSTTLKIITRIEQRVKLEKILNFGEFYNLVCDEVKGLLSNIGNLGTPAIVFPPIQPWVVLVIGVNGVGKTTTIGKLAFFFQKMGKKVIIGAADTFRAAAVNQISTWAERAHVEIIQQGEGADPASVAFDTLQAAISRNSHIVLIDTAGRLHNKINLLKQLVKIQRVMKKIINQAPHEVLLVLDGSTGQNAFEQTKAFQDIIKITGLIVTKLDGTAKGGIIIGISDYFQIPVKYIGIGESIEDLRSFDKDVFIDSFFNTSFLKKIK